MWLECDFTHAIYIKYRCARSSTVIYIYQRVMCPWNWYQGWQVLYNINWRGISCIRLCSKLHVLILFVCNMNVISHMRSSPVTFKSKTYVPMKLVSGVRLQFTFCYKALVYILLVINTFNVLNMRKNLVLMFNLWLQIAVNIQIHTDYSTRKLTTKVSEYFYIVSIVWINPIPVLINEINLMLFENMSMW